MTSNVAPGLFAHCPEPGESIAWQRVESHAWMRRMESCPQDPEHHGEGDVGTHTRMVAEALIEDPAWQELPQDERGILFVAALLHDVGKPDCTRLDGDRVTSRGHSARGAILARRLLWEMGVPFELRERVAALVRFHMLPFFLIDRKDAERLALKISWVSRCDHQAILARADLRGRISAHSQQAFENVDLFEVYCDDLGCLARPYPFPTGPSRFEFFRTPGRYADYPAHDASSCEVYLLSGLPGAGKDSWIGARCANWPVVSLDLVRRERGVAPTDNQGGVIRAAKERAREHLRASTDFVWNATNLSNRVRSGLIDLFAAYDARVRIVYVEASADRLFEQNRNRTDPIPDAVITSLMDRWEVPDWTEAHSVEYHVDGREAFVQGDGDAGEGAAHFSPGERGR